MKEVNNIIKKFTHLNTWDEKYKYLIFLGNKLPILKKEKKNKTNLVLGCQSRIWINICIDKVTNKLIIEGDSESLIPKGILYIIIKKYSNKNILQIINYKNSFIKKIGFKEFLSSIRTNGINLIINKIKLFALTYYQIRKNNIKIKNNIFCE